MDMGRAIKHCRVRKDWSLRDLSKECGIVASHLSMIERNLRSASITSLQEIANALGIPLIVLVFLASDPNDLFGISTEVQEKLSYAALQAFRLPATKDWYRFERSTVRAAHVAAAKETGK